MTMTASNLRDAIERALETDLVATVDAIASALRAFGHPAGGDALERAVEAAANSLDVVAVEAEGGSAAPRAITPAEAYSRARQEFRQHLVDCRRCGEHYTSVTTSATGSYCDTGDELADIAECLRVAE